MNKRNQSMTSWDSDLFRPMYVPVLTLPYYFKPMKDEVVHAINSFETVRPFN